MFLQGYYGARMKKLLRGLGYLLGMAVMGAGVAVVSIIVKTIIQHYWGV